MSNWRKIMVEPYKPLYTVKQVSKILLVNVNEVYDLINSKKLPYLQLGSKKVRGSDLEKFIETYPEYHQINSPVAQ